MATVPQTKIKISKYLRMLIYGRSDAGKTLLASNTPFTVKGGVVEAPFGTVIHDVLFCDADGGSDSTLNSLGVVMAHKHPSDGRFSVFAHALEIPERVKELGDIKFVVIDTLTRFQESLLLPRMGGDLEYQQRDWGFVRNAFSRLESSLLDLPCHIIATAHVEEREDKSLPAIGIREVYDKRTGLTEKVKAFPSRLVPALQGSFRNMVDSYFDVVAYYASEQVTNKAGQALMAHVLHTRESPAYRARCKLAYLPEHLVNPTLPKIISIFETRRKELIEKLKEVPEILIEE